ncbi:MAG: DNA polymerase III subunit alpha [Alistipes sp.]|nr:DNA polymerase III subunit alpha [Alistipes sp.]
MQNFVHLHVHTQYSLLDGQASISRLVDKALKDGMPGIAVTDHGNMFGIKEFWNYVGKKNKAKHDSIKSLVKLRQRMVDTSAEHPDLDAYKQELSTLVSEKQAQIAASTVYSLEDNEELANLRSLLSSVESMEKEFGYSVETADEKIAALQAIDDFKPIIGCEVYVAREDMRLKRKEVKEDRGGWHLILLAKNLQGYKNLIKIVSRAWTDGFYNRPRTDHRDLERYHEGIICCSACIGGEIPKLLLAGRMEEAERSILWHKSIFGDDYYLELQRHKATVERANHETYPLQQQVNEHLVALARKHNIKLICTNDVHFVNEEDAEAHDRLITINSRQDFDSPDRMLYSKQEWMKTRAEMSELFADYPESLANTLEICDKVEFYSIDHAPIMPMFDIPADFGTEEQYRARFTEQDLYNEFTRDENGNEIMSEKDAQKKIENLGGYDRLYRIKFEADYLAHLTMIGAKRRYGDPLDAETAERLKFELHIMKTMGFPGYFLIVQDFIAAARKELGVWVGPGRGSAAGSAVAYCLGITQIDPIKYDLLFERFLNPDRISLPDIDIDFDDEGRGRVLEWVTNKYGKEKVAHIITYGTMATKMALKDVARVQQLPLSESDRLCKLIPARIPDPKNKDKQLKVNLANSIAYVAELQEAANSSDPIMRDTIKYALQLEGNVRGTGVHACGTIICRDDITDWVPVSTADDKETGEKMLVTQYEGSVIEDTGLIKMDFLGLKNLTIMKDAIENIRRIKGIEVDIDAIPIDDPATYRLYCEGRTVGTFQFESPGMQKYLRELQPSVFEDLIAMNALYRPGPMDYIPDFIDRKQGRKPIVYDIPIMEKYLKDTYGITVYQEQVMLLSRLLADFTRGESDTLRKAMGKKLKDKLDALKPKFLKGGIRNGHDKDVLEKIWADWEKFASYAFNKSHATCYSWVAYQTAYLKANFPSEYMAALLSSNLNDITTLTEYINESQQMGIKVLSPDVNESMLRFSSNRNGDIRFGLAAIKGVGEAAAQSIIDERERGGQYKDIYDFFERVNYSVVNRKCLESMAYAGCFDNITTFSRCKFFAPESKDSPVTFLEQLVRYGQRQIEEKLNAQQSLFSMFAELNGSGIQQPKVPVCDEWSTLKRLGKEREVVGIYLSSHPLDDYKPVIDHMCNATISDLNRLEENAGKELVFACVTVSGEERTTADGKYQYGILGIEDYTDKTEIRLKRKDFERFRNFLHPDYYLLIRGEVRSFETFDKDDVHKLNPIKRTFFNIGSITQLQDVVDGIQSITLYLNAADISQEFVTEFYEAAKHSKGKTAVKVSLYDVESGVSVNMHAKKLKVLFDDDVRKILERYNVQYRLN